MAKVTFSPTGVRRYSGALGHAVYRRRGKETILAERPEPSSRPPSEAQLAHRQRFRRAINYGKRVMRDPAWRAVFEEAARRSGQPIFSLAIQDYFNGPEVEEIELADYRGTPGDTISVVAEDDIEVVRVDVAVREADGTLLEEGQASMEFEGWWVYTTTASVSPGTEVRITATAFDGPGNEHTLEKETILRA